MTVGFILQAYYKQFMLLYHAFNETQPTDLMLCYISYCLDRLKRMYRFQ